MRATDACGAGVPSGMDAVGIDVQLLSQAALGWDKLALAEGTAVLRGVHGELAVALEAGP